jgi:transcriptional regulator with XRE-family HTH domain
VSPHPVKIRRVVLGMTQDQLAQAAGVSRYTVARIEGRHFSEDPRGGPRRDTRRRLASTLKAPQDWLFPDEPRRRS